MDKPRKLPKHALTGTVFPIVQNLPPHVYEGIGKIIFAHGILETQVSDLLFDIAKIDYSIGRIAFRYQAASERFEIVKRLMILHGFHPPPNINLNELQDQITYCCNTRDQFAHGVWIEQPDGKIALRLTKGEFETDEGIVDRSILPEGIFVPDDYYESTKQSILLTAEIVNALRLAVHASLQARALEASSPPQKEGDTQNHNPPIPPLPPQSSRA